MLKIVHSTGITNIFLIEYLYYIHMYYTTLTFLPSIGLAVRENYIGIIADHLKSRTSRLHICSDMKKTEIT